MDFKTINELVKQFKNNKKHWNVIVESMANDGIMTESKLNTIPNDVWSWAKRCISDSDEILIKWFNSNIPAFYGEKPVDIIRLVNGEDVLKELMLCLPN
jgi:hypothetical protein